MKLIWMIPLFTATCLFAKDLGRWGETFAVEENNLAESMKSKAALHEAEIEKYGEEIEKYIQNPTPIEGIGKALERRVSFYDPTYTVEEDIKVDGRVFAKKGEKLNLLEKVDLPGGMLFFDGSNLSQVAWARKQPIDFKWVLVKGSPVALEEEEGRPVYFDQMGYFTSLFDICHVPATVVQEGTFLRIEEIPVDEEGTE